jgi:hypothetical protein
MKRRIEEWSRTHNELFHGIIETIGRWFVTVTSTEGNPEVRVTKWLESSKSTQSWIRSDGDQVDDVEALREFAH